MRRSVWNLILLLILLTLSLTLNAQKASKDAKGASSQVAPGELPQAPDISTVDSLESLDAHWWILNTYLQGWHSDWTKTASFTLTTLQYNVTDASGQASQTFIDLKSIGKVTVGKEVNKYTMAYYLLDDGRANGLYMNLHDLLHDKNPLPPGLSFLLSIHWDPRTDSNAHASAQVVADSLTKLGMHARGEDKAQMDAKWANFKQQAAAWRAATVKPPMSDDARQAFLMAESNVQSKQFINAIAYYERGLRLYPTDPKDQWNAAMIWDQLNCPEDAIYHARAYLELQPDAPDAPAVRDQLLIWEAKAGVPHVAETAPAVEHGGIAAILFEAPHGMGVRLSTMLADGPAAQAGLRPNDIVTAVNGTSVNSPDELGNALQKSSAGSTLTFDYLRGGALNRTTVTLIASSKLKNKDFLESRAQQGDLYAQTLLSAMLLRGDGVQQNDAEGLEWLRKAAEGGGEDGEFGLGYLYYNGKVVPKDLTQAANWYRKAADQGNLDAQKALDELAKQGVTPAIGTAPTTQAFVAAGKPSAVDGDWSGAIDTSAGPLPAVIHVKSDRAGKEYVAFDSPKQNAFGLTGNNATLNGDEFSFDLPIVHGHYNGKLSPDGNTITGTWNQGTPLPLNLTRTVMPVATEKPLVAIGTAPPTPATNSKPPADWVRFQQNAAAWRSLTQKPALPAAAVAQRTQAEAAYGAKDFRGAIAHYRQGLAMAPMWPEGWYNMGLLCGELNDYACAVDGLKHYLELRPDASDAAAVRRQMNTWQAKVAQ